jgi:hypothetical protein
MNHQKDTQKLDLNSYGQTDVGTSNTLLHKPVSDFSNKKTEKLVTALYMVTDCMDSGDAIKGKLRQLGVELLSDMHKLSILLPVDKHSHISLLLAHIHEILSLVEIACTIGFVSDMNTSILKREFDVLILELQANQSKDKHFTFSLNEKLFEIETPAPKILEGSNIKDKRTVLNMSFKNDIASSNLSIIKTKGLVNHKLNILDKKERSEKIISLIKDISVQQGKREVSIKDISSSFIDCSEKTIQRELNLLVSLGQVKKIGAKRWSRYQAIQ